MKDLLTHFSKLSLDNGSRMTRKRLGIDSGMTRFSLASLICVLMLTLGVGNVKATLSSPSSCTFNGYGSVTMSHSNSDVVWTASSAPSNCETTGSKRGAQWGGSVVNASGGLTLTCKTYNGATITKIEVVWSRNNAKGASVSAKVNGVAFGSTDTNTASTTNRTATFTGSSSGTITINATSTGSGNSFYIQSITVTYSDDVLVDRISAKGFGGYTTNSFSTAGTDYTAVGNLTNMTGSSYALQVFNGSSGQIKGSGSARSGNFNCRNTTTKSGYYISKVTLTVASGGTLDGSVSGRSEIYFGTSAYSNPNSTAPSGSATVSTENASGQSTLTWTNSNTNVSYFCLYDLKTASTAKISDADNALVITWTKKPSCTAPNHVDITPTAVAGNYGYRYTIGETIKLTATAYSSAGTGSPIAAANITGYQWQKYKGSSWTNLANGLDATDGGTFAGVTTANLQISGCTSSNTGSYRCVVSTGATCSTESSGYMVYVYTLDGNYYGSAWTQHAITWTGEKTGTVTVNLNAKQVYEFKVKDNNGKEYGSGPGNYIIQTGDSKDCGTGNVNVRLLTAPAGNYTFTIDITNAQAGSPYVNVVTTYPSVSHPNEGYVYVQKFGWRPKLYYWYDGSNELTTYASSPDINSDQYTTICGTDYWYIPVINYYCNFKAYNGYDNTGDQHTNSPHPGQKLYNDGSWKWGEFSTYTISFAGNGNTGGSMTNVTGICPDADETLAACGFTKSDHTFTGWKTNAALTYVADGDADDGTHEVDVAVNGIVPNQAKIKRISSNITLTAQWVHVPEITVSETARAFGDKAVDGGPYDMTFNVSGQYLTGNISLAISGTNAGMFSVSPNSLTPTTGTVSSTEITVSYSPTGAGSHSATLTISSDGATSKTVALTGTGKWEVTWNNNGATSTTLVANSTKPTFPSTPSSCDATSTTFIGWATAAWSGKLASLAGKTVHTSNSTMSNITANGTTYYAVFAKGTGSASNEYQLVTAVNQLNEGDKIVIANAGSSSTYLMGKDTVTEAGYQFRKVAQVGSFSISSSKITISTLASSATDRNNPHVFTVGKSGDYWTFYDPLNSAYISCASVGDSGSGTKNGLGYESPLSDAGKWSISISDNVATILSQIGSSTTTRNRLQANGNPFSTASSFTCTKNTMTDPYIFRNLSNITYSDYLTTCCDKNITIGTPSITGGGTVTFTLGGNTIAPGDEVETCSGAKDIVATVTPSAGYSCTALSFSGGNVSVDPTPGAGNYPSAPSAQNYTLSFEANTTATLATTATFTAKTASAWEWKYNGEEIPDPLVLYVGINKQLDVTYTPDDLLNTQKNYTVTKTDAHVAQGGKAYDHYTMRGAAGVTEVTNTTVTFTLSGLSKEVNVTVKPQPRVHFIDIVHGESFADVGPAVESYVATFIQPTPTHSDVSDPGVNYNSCERGHLHLLGWIESTWADAHPGATSAAITGAGSGKYYEAGANINVEDQNGKTFYAVWCVIE